MTLWMVVLNIVLLFVDSHLSVEKVFQAVKGVNWRRFGEELIKEKRDGLYVDELDPTTNLDRIYSSYQSDEARLRAVVEEFLTETYDPPWRGVIWALYCADEIVKAQQISSYAELLQGMLEHKSMYFIYPTSPATGVL